MRRNSFGEAYCKTSDDVKVELSNRSTTTKATYAQVMFSEEEGEHVAEILDNDTGDLILYVEADSKHAIEAILIGSGWSRSDIQHL